MKSPAPLKTGDKISLVAPARKISKQALLPAIELIERQGFTCCYEEALFSEDHQYAGSDALRAAQLQQALDDPGIRAIFFARGGYGSVRIIDQLDFNAFQQHPKWLVGYSDITVFHNHINRQLKIQTLHASMPINFSSNTRLSIDSLFQTLRGRPQTMLFPAHPLNRPGRLGGALCGGNLSVLYSLLGSASFPETSGKILFLEDLDEYLYHIDRMMMALKRAGILSGLSGLVVGGMTDMNDNTIPFGKTADEIIREAVDAYDYPVYFGCPAGHVDDNRALVMGGYVQIVPEGEHIRLSTFFEAP